MKRLRVSPKPERARSGEDAVAALAPATNMRVSRVLRWSPKSDVVGVTAQEWRWWTEWIVVAVRAKRLPRNQRPAE